MHGNLYVLPHRLNVSTLTRASLEPLPFASNEFDYVHLFGAAFCVPEDKVYI